MKDPGEVVLQQLFGFGYSIEEDPSPKRLGSDAQSSFRSLGNRDERLGLPWDTSASRSKKAPATALPPIRERKEEFEVFGKSSDLLTKAFDL